MAEVENQIANAALETVNIRTRVSRLKKVLAELDDHIAGQNKIINKSEQEIVKRNAIIERKQNQVDLMNKKLNQMIAAAGVRKLIIASFFFILILYFKFLRLSP